ncbi:capsule assembly Wzi family protein [Arsenicibacter rosenii]|uniref:Capsule assembly Wzi family protein n=1 Tax=Arsenicibacter rosenii TaxID=1750698 RepID=A0A1S2VGA7_9BACT|nr:capsule assembly Wzi family protein [Arsenicibacter rosenii]OIN57236.1 hypothetical protein BLX24_21020 [Arsenicibacter rosenii]
MSELSKVALWLCAFGLTTPLVKAQIQTVKAPTQYSGELGSYFSSSARTPFWLRSNEYGIVPLKSPAATARFGLYSDYDSAKVANRKTDYGYGINLVGNIGPAGGVLLPELYAKIRFNIFEIYAGRRREHFGLADTSLTSGSYAWSGNALPIPKIQISIPQFTPLRFTKGWLSVMGTFAHGWMQPKGYVNHSLLHQKTLYFRLGRPHDVVRLYAGFNHQAIWGGESKELQRLGLTVGPTLPSSFRDYIYVVTGLLNKKDTTKLTNFDITNRVGNHLGTIDLGAEIDLVRYSLFLYRQNIYEDGSLFYLINITDGLNGIRLRSSDANSFFREVVFELLNTKSQGGPEFVIEDPLKRGKDDYFNHSQFRDGWGYYGRGIGTPFIPPNMGPNDANPKNPFTLNNRVTVWHLGISGTLVPLKASFLESPVTYQTKLSISNSLGTYNFPFARPKNQFSGIVSLIAPTTWLGGLNIRGSVAIDAGDLYPNSVGAYIGLQKVWQSK